VSALWIKTIAPGSYDIDDDEFLEYGECMLSKSSARKPLLNHAKNDVRPASGLVQGFPYQAVPSNGRIKVVYDTSFP
jgi:hypothetical protein